MIDSAKVRIDIQSLTHAFGVTAQSPGRCVLQDITLQVHDGEFVSLVGPSGCGKTTLLNIIEGFQQVQAGRVLIDEVPVSGVLAGRIAFMFARDNLLPWRTAVANVRLAMEMRGGRPDEKKARRLLGLVGLGGFEDHYPGQLSQGMRQRVALARTLAVDATIWLMDEPFGALDASTKTRLQDELMNIWEAQHPTVIFVTHDLSEAIALSDRVVVMSPSPGRIKNVYRIELPRPRRVIELHGQAEFLELYRALWGDLKVEIRRSAADEGIVA
jgi:NitT/TauT family transport system ATP-binding protein